MKTVLIPIDDSADAEWTSQNAIQLYHSQQVKIFLLNVELPLSKYVARFVSKQNLNDFHVEAGMKYLQPVVDKLTAAGIPHSAHVVVGHKAESIVQFAKQHGCDCIMVPKSQKRRSKNLGLGSIGSQLRQLIGADGSCDINEAF